MSEQHDRTTSNKRWLYTQQVAERIKADDALWGQFTMLTYASALTLERLYLDGPHAAGDERGGVGGGVGVQGTRSENREP